MLVDYIPHPRGGEEAAILEVFNAVVDPLPCLPCLRPPLACCVPIRCQQYGCSCNRSNQGTVTPKNCCLHAVGVVASNYATLIDIAAKSPIPNSFEGVPVKRDQALATLRIEKDRLSRDYGVKSLALFGSVARLHPGDCRQRCGPSCRVSTVPLAFWLIRPASSSSCWDALSIWVRRSLKPLLS